MLHTAILLLTRPKQRARLAGARQINYYLTFCSNYKPKAKNLVDRTEKQVVSRINLKGGIWEKKVTIIHNTRKINWTIRKEASQINEVCPAMTIYRNVIHRKNRCQCPWRYLPNAWYNSSQFFLYRVRAAQ